MEPKPKIAFKAKYFSLTSTQSLGDYATLLAKMYNNLHKYSIVSNLIKLDTFGNPYTIFTYKDNLSEMEKEESIIDCFGEIIPVSDLERYETVCTSHLDKELEIIYINEFMTKSKEDDIFVPIIFYIVIYLKANGNIKIKPNMTVKITPENNNSRFGE